MRPRMRTTMMAAATLALVLMMTPTPGGAEVVGGAKPPATEAGADRSPSSDGWVAGGSAETTVGSPYALVDTRGDSLYTGGDIISIRVVEWPYTPPPAYRQNEVRLILVAKGLADLYTSPQWVIGYSNIQWAIDVNGGAADFFVNGWNDGSAPRGDMVRADGSGVACEVSFGATPPPKPKFTLIFDRSCLSSPPWIRAAARLEFDKFPTDPQAPISLDRSPNGGRFTPRVTPAT